MSTFAQLKVQHTLYGHKTFISLLSPSISDTAIANVCTDLGCSRPIERPAEDHIWERTVFRGNPAFKCATCGFIWQSHMHKPRVTCEQIRSNPNGRKK